MDKMKVVRHIVHFLQKSDVSHSTCNFLEVSKHEYYCHKVKKKSQRYCCSCGSSTLLYISELKEITGAGGMKTFWAVKNGFFSGGRFSVLFYFHSTLFVYLFIVYIFKALIYHLPVTLKPRYKAKNFLYFYSPIISSTTEPSKCAALIQL